VHHILHRVVFVLLLALGAGCAANEPRASAGGQYVEEIRGPLPRDVLLFGPDCVVR
jgi:hypothetical protein